MKLNWNTILAILGGLGVFAPDVASVAAWLASLNVAWLAFPVRVLGFLAVFFAAAPLAVPKLRAFLASLGLATAPGAVAPSTTPAAQPAAPLVSADRTPVTIENPTGGQNKASAHVSYGYCQHCQDVANRKP